MKCCGRLVGFKKFDDVCIEAKLDKHLYCHIIS